MEARASHRRRDGAARTLAEAYAEFEAARRRLYTRVRARAHHPLTGDVYKQTVRTIDHAPPEEMVKLAARLRRGRWALNALGERAGGGKAAR